MSSVAGWMSLDPLPLSKIRDSFAAMRKELSFETHYNPPFGSQFTVFFKKPDDFELATIQKAAAKNNIPLVTSQTSLGGYDFVEVRAHLTERDDFGLLFNNLRLDKIKSNLVLAEQTAEDFRDAFRTNPGFYYDDKLALACCGGITLMFEETKTGPQIMKALAGTVDTHKELAVLLGWFRKVMGDLPAEQAYAKVLKQTPTYLFSILFDARGEDLLMIGLRQNEVENGYVSPHNHLVYVKNKSAVFMARTETGLMPLLKSYKTAKIHHVGDKKPSILSYSELSAIE